VSGLLVRENRVSSRLMRGAEGCGGLADMIGWFMFSFCCGMILSENKGRWDTEEVFRGTAHLDIILSAVLLAS